MIQDFIHEFKGFGRIPSKCKVTIFPIDGKSLVCFKDIGIGTSITNDSERIASEVVNILDLHPSNCRFFETYNNSSFDEITYQWSLIHGKWKAEEPDWRPASNEIINLLTNKK